MGFIKASWDTVESFNFLFIPRSFSKFSFVLLFASKSFPNISFSSTSVALSGGGVLASPFVIINPPYPQSHKCYTYYS